METSNRVITSPEINDRRRADIVDNYKCFMPNIGEKVSEIKNKKFDVGFLYSKFKAKEIENRFNTIANIVVDIRNNTKPTNYYSNSISKTDNKFSNETKRMIKHLLSKGWTNNEIAYEVEKIYGSGSITYTEGLENDSNHPLLRNVYKVFKLYCIYKVFKFIIPKIKF